MNHTEEGPITNYGIVPGLQRRIAELDRIANEAVDLNHKQALRFTACEAERDRYRKTIRSFLSTVLTVKRENQQEWMEYLAERINEVCEVIGEEDRVAYNPSHEAILPIKK